MDFETVLMQFVIGLIAFVANLFSALAGGGAGLVQLPALILLGLPFSIALATHKIASVALGLGAGLRHVQEKNLKPGLVLFILGFGLMIISDFASCSFRYFFFESTFISRFVS